ncbi:MAG: Rv2175c family DNA-binding protein [Actinomycetota bacterium]
MSSIPTAEDVLAPEEDVYDLPTVARLLGVPVSKVHQHLREGHLIAVRRGREVVIPKAFFDDEGHVIKPLPGLLVVLHDGGYRETEIVRWLFTPDPSLTISRDGDTERRANARPVDALRSHQAREVVRRAQAMAY